MEKQENLLEIGIGEETKIEKKACEVLNFKEVEVEGTKDGKKQVVEILLQHPDLKEPLQIRKLKYQKGDKIKISGLWVSLDKENKLSYNSALAYFLRYYKANNLKEMIGKKVETDYDFDGEFLVIKAY